MANFTLIVDLMILALGTYGAISLVGDFVELDRFPSFWQLMHTVRNHWKATLALIVANLFFFLRIYMGLFR